MKPLNLLITLLIVGSIISCKEENKTPKCQIISPVEGDIFYCGEKVEINVNAFDDDGEIHELQFYVNGVGISSLEKFPHNFYWETKNQPQGEYEISVIAFDNERSQTESTVKVKLEKLKTGKFADNRDGHNYSWVQIGDQVWMTENLAYMPYVSAPNQQPETFPHYYVYGYTGNDIEEAKDSINYKKYGTLYNWEAALTACPAGWHLPSNKEWNKLAEYISKVNNEYDFSSDTWYNVGIHLKSQLGWEDSGNGTDDYKFNAIPGGIYESYNKGFYSQNNIACWWSRTEFNDYKAWNWILQTDNSELKHIPYGRSSGLSIRCVKN